MKNPQTGNIEPAIIQFWQNGNGYQIFRMESSASIPASFELADVQTAANNMIKHGGSFVKFIGEALHKADHENTVKLITAFLNTTINI